MNDLAGIFTGEKKQMTFPTLSKKDKDAFLQLSKMVMEVR